MQSGIVSRRCRLRTLNVEYIYRQVYVKGFFCCTNLISAAVFLIAENKIMVVGKNAPPSWVSYLCNVLLSNAEYSGH